MNEQETTGHSIQQLIGKSKNGTDVNYDPVHSHAATHFEDTPKLKQLVTEVISTMTLDGQEIVTHIDMGKVVGTCDVVDVDDTDEIVYGVRKTK